MTINQNILLGITGSIAAYKTPELVRLLQQQNFNVKVVLSHQASQFVAPLTLKALCHDTVYCADEHELETAMPHIELARWAEHIVIAPASAHCIAKLAHGLADDLLSMVCLASKAKITIAPAMNPLMWSNAATQANVKVLKQRAVNFLGPDTGEHACGDQGLGRMLEPAKIVAQLAVTTPGVLHGRRVLITAGPTYELIDPVRFLGNYSSGKMGYALAQAAAQAGAEVTLISGPTALTPPPLVQLLPVTTAAEMLEACQQQVDKHDIFISAAAVADYHYPDCSSQKIKKSAETLTLNLQKNPDILATIKQQSPGVFCVGFAAETENVVENAIKKLQHKQLDAIIANLVGSGNGFGSDQNAVTFIDAELNRTDFLCEDKFTLAVKLIQQITRLFIAKQLELQVVGGLKQESLINA